MALLKKREELADLCPPMSGLPLLYRVESSLANREVFLQVAEIAVPGPRVSHLLLPVPWSL